MADYLVTGKKGSGKSLAMVGRIKQALIEGKKVATNLDIYLDVMMLPVSKKTLIRLPDKPSIEDLEAIGSGNDSPDEDLNGLIILDETSAFLNARTYADKARQPVLDWLIHSRKLGWDTYFLAQGPGQIDKQIRDTQIEFHVPIKRMDRLQIPLVTWLTRQLFGKKHEIRFPKIHLAIVKYGMDINAMTVDKWWYRAKDLYSCYNTRQIFIPPEHPQAVGIHCLLSAWHLKGRYMPKKFTLWQVLRLVPKMPFYLLAVLSVRLGWMTRVEAFSRT